MNFQKLGQLIIAGLFCAGLVLVCQVLINTDEANAVAANPQAGQSTYTTTVQLGRDAYGIAMIDTASEHIWLYEVNKSAASHSKLKLIAARSYKYDKLLDQYNTGEPSPDQVSKLLEKTEVIRQKGFGSSATGRSRPANSD